MIVRLERMWHRARARRRLVHRKVVQRVSSEWQLTLDHQHELREQRQKAQDDRRAAREKNQRRAARHQKYAERHRMASERLTRRRAMVRARKLNQRRPGSVKPVAPLPANARLTYRPPEENEAEFRPLEFGLIRRVLSYMGPHRKSRNILFVCTLVRGLQGPALAALVTSVINGPVAGGDIRGTLWGCAGYLVLAIFTQWTLYYRQKLALELGEAIVHDLRREIFAHLQGMTLNFYNKTHVGRIISRMTSDIEVIRSLVQEVLFISLIGLGQMLFSAIFMFYYDRVLFLLILGLAPLLWAMNFYFRRRVSQAMRLVQESFSRVTATLAESVSGIRVTQSFVRQDINARIFHDLVADHSSFSMMAVRRSGALPPLLELNSQIFMAGLLLLGGIRVLTPDIDHTTAIQRMAALVGFYMMSSNFFNPVANIGTMYNQALSAMAGAERVFRLLDSKPDFVDPPGAVILPPIQGRVEFRNLSFGYVPDRLVLRDINFTVRPGQTVALVGHTGSGKSSMIQLIAKFYLPASGELLIDGHSIHNIDSDSLHRQMGTVSQVNFLFTGTVMENIRFGRPDATDEEVIDACRRLDVLDLIEAMPEGFATEVGERGESVSLGQRQVICFARSLLANPRIMILDEATSSVDTMTERRLQKALEVLLHGRTSFVVAHRLSTIRHADIVLVLDQGRIVERGTHHQLLRAGGVYANLYRQFIRANAPKAGG